MTNETYISYETSIGGKIILKRCYTYHKVPYRTHQVASDISLFLHHSIEDLLIRKIVLRKFGHHRCQRFNSFIKRLINHIMKNVILTPKYINPKSCSQQTFHIMSTSEIWGVNICFSTCASSIFCMIKNVPFIIKNKMFILLMETFE